MGCNSLTHSTVDSRMGFPLQPWIPLWDFRQPLSPQMGFPQLLNSYKIGDSLCFFSIPLDPFWDFFHLAMDLPMGFLSPPGSPYGISVPFLDPPMGFISPHWIPLWGFCDPPGSPYGISFTPGSSFGISFSYGISFSPWIPLWDFPHSCGSLLLEKVGWPTQLSRVCTHVCIISSEKSPYPLSPTPPPLPPPPSPPEDFGGGGGVRC